MNPDLSRDLRAVSKPDAPRLHNIETMNSDSPRPRLDCEQILRAAAASGMHGSGSRGAARIMAALCDPVVTASQVASLVIGEPALYARVLRVANSAYYGQSRSVTTIERALALLGMNAVRGIAAAACLDRVVPQSSGSSLLNFSEVVSHSHAAALASEALARIKHGSLASDAFIGGLLHNLGIVLQLQLDSPGVSTMIERRRSGDERDMRALELECVTIGHEDCIGVVFEAWRLPETLISAIRNHHDPLSAPEPHRPLAALINLGATLGLAAGSTFALEPTPVDRRADAMTCLKLDEDQIDGVALALPERLADFKQALQSL
jgi:HD-like signal output (HDOD) protein